MLNQNLYATLSLALVIFGGGPVPSADARETGGLAAHYYNERDLDTTSRVKIVHEGVEIPDFQWTKDNLPPHGRKLFFSVRWLGSIQAPEPGEYQFEVMADDGARLVLDGNLLIDSWFTQAGSTATSEPVTLQEGSWTDILLEYRQMLGDGAIQLRWKTPGSREFTVVPGEHLSPQPPPSPWRVSAVRFMPASGKAATMKGGRFTGSNMSATNGFEEIATIREEPGEGWNELPVENAEVYRWIKYEGPQGSHGQIAELRFLHEDRALSGEPFGTAGPGTEPWNAAFDDNPQTAYSGDDPDDQYVGIGTILHRVFKGTSGRDMGAVFILNPEVGGQKSDVRCQSLPCKDFGEIRASPNRRLSKHAYQLSQNRSDTRAIIRLTSGCYISELPL